MEDMRGIHASIEYPIDKMAYPGIWCDFQDTGSLQIAGINHREYSDPAIDSTFRRYTRWRFSGYAQFTVVALTSLQRDRLYDEVVRVCAFNGGTDGASSTDLPSIGRFRQAIENNDFIACNMDFDEIEPTGNAAAPGTPWGSDEIIYERSLNMEIIGEFISDGATQDLVPLSHFILSAQMENPDGSYTDAFPAYNGHPDNAPDDPSAWH